VQRCKYLSAEVLRSRCIGGSAEVVMQVIVKVQSRCKGADQVKRWFRADL
jgi:hypothetical protein